MQNNKLSADKIEILSKVAKAIIDLSLENDNKKQAYTKFYKVMRKYGIKQGVKTKGGGIQCNTPEWVMCEVLFKSRVEATYMLESLFSTPKDLMSY